MYIYQKNLPECHHPECSNPVTEKLKKGQWKMYCSNKCRGQHNSLKSRNKAKITCMKNYGVEHPSQSQSIKDKKKQTCITKYGVEHHLESLDIRRKITETNLERYGAEMPFANEQVKQKIKETNLEKYGTEHPTQSEEIIEKRKKVWVEKYGVENPMHLQLFVDKGKMTNLERYGVENPMQCPEIFQKCQSSNRSSKYKLKDYAMPSGEIIRVQGYEPQALDILLESYNEDEIVVKDNETPDIWYMLDGVKHRYYPDIYIPKDNLIIEVKSQYTYEANLKKNLAKQQGCLDLGYNFRFMIL